MISGPHFDLVISTHSSSERCEIRLLDFKGLELARRICDFNAITASARTGIFNLREYVRIYFDVDQQRAAVAKIGVCIAKEVLGHEIFENLWRSTTPRTLRVVLPGATLVGSPLAGSLARVPWEISRPTLQDNTLADRNLAVRVVHGADAFPSLSPELSPNNDLRVLFVFGEARNTYPPRCTARTPSPIEPV